MLLTGTLGSNKSTFTNPDGTTATGSISNRYEAFAGAEFPLDPNGLSLRLTGGIHVSAGMSGSGGSEHFTRFPLEATLWYPLGDKARIGGGALRDARALQRRRPQHQRRPERDARPDPGLGYALMPHLLLDGRYVYERFERASGGDVEASHWGVGLTAIY